MTAQSAHARAHSRFLGHRRFGNLDIAAEWCGLVLVGFVLGSAVVRLMTSLGDVSGGPHPIGSLQQTGLLAGVTAVVVLAAGRVAWPVITAASLVALWPAAAALSAWVLTGQFQARPLWMALTCFGLALGAGAGRPARTGWTILAVGTLLVYANWWALWRNYATQGAAFPQVLQMPPWIAPYDKDMGPLAWVWEVLQGDLPGTRVGLTPNGNLTGNYLAFFVVFSLPFLLNHVQRGRAGGATPSIAWGALTIFLTAPGLGLLVALNARTATVAVLLGWTLLLVPWRWFAGRGWAWAAAILCPVVMLLPVLLGLGGQVTLSGRDCVWHSWWRAVSDSPIWGIGPPGRFPGVGCSVSTWAHAHNELLQALTVAGAIGFAAAVATFSLLAWFGVRYASRDGRCLLVLVACGVVLLSMEVMSLWAYNWISPAVVAFVAIAFRSLGLATRSVRDTPPEDSRD